MSTNTTTKEAPPVTPADLKDLREKVLLSQGALGRRAGVSSSMIGAIERGDARPSSAMLSKVLEALIAVVVEREVAAAFGSANEPSSDD